MKLNFLISLSLCLLGTSVFAQAPVIKHLSPSASELLDAMVKQTILVRQEVYAAVQGLSPTITANDVLTGNLKFTLTTDLTTNPRTVKITLVPATGTGFSLNPAENPLATSLKKLAALNYPAGLAADITAGQWRAQAVPTALNAAIFEAFVYCRDKVKETTKEFWFEMMPLHLYCHAVSLPNLNSYNQIITMDNYADATPAVLGAADFDKYRLKVAGELAIGAVIHQAHLEIQKDPLYVRNKARCFPVGKPFVQTVIASMAIPFKYAVDGGPGVLPKFDYGPVGMMSMPEGNYALGAAAKYYSDDKATVFNNVPPMAKSMAAVADAPSIRFNGDTYKTFVLDADGVLHFNFNVRDLDSPSCVGIFFCNKSAPAMASPLQGG